MRLGVLERGHRWTQKLFFCLMRLQMGHVPGPIKTLTYRRRWFGAHFLECLQEGMRRIREWRKAEAELFAALVSKLNRCEY